MEAPAKEQRATKPHPFITATYRHERWCLDIRYIEHHQIPEIKGPFYVITVLEAFSRAILSSDIFQGQDLGCVLIVLYSAIEQFGPPDHLISGLVIKREYDTWRSRERHVIAWCFNTLKHVRRMFSRFEQLDRPFLGFLPFCCTLLWVH